MNPAFKSFVAAYKNIKTSTRLCSALYTFGKYHGAAAALKSASKLKRRSVERLTGTTTSIGVQPTSLARRRVHMGRGARRLTSGRPPKALHSSEHGYAVQPSVRRSVMPALRGRRPAPHSISHALTFNHSLGKTHSAKSYCKLGLQDCLVSG